MAVLLTVLGLVSGPGSGLAQVASEKTPTLISLDVKQMDLQDVLRLIAEKANVNIIAGKEVAGALTLRLRNVDLWQALEAVLGASGLTYREEKGIIRVGKLEELVEEKPPPVTEIILLKYAKAGEAKEVCQHLLSSSGTIEIDVRTNALIINDISQNIEKIRQVVTKLDAKLPPVLEKKRFQLDYIDTTEKEERDLLKDALGNIIGEEGSFFIDPLTNSVYVEAPSSYIKKVKEYFEGADVRDKRIMIKAEFVEIQLTAGEKLGIKWRWKGAYEKYPLGATFGYPYQTRSESGEIAPSPGPSTLAEGMGIIFGSAEQEFRGIIDLLISEGKAHLLSSPNIVTLEGYEATIDVGDKHPYRVTKYIEGVWVETIEFVTVGATLVVTPHIKEEGKVVLDIHPDVSELTGPPPFTGAPPIVGTREAESRIMVEDGKTIVVGGLLRETEKETREGVPFLSRLPIIGSLFTRKEVDREKTDLLVFITPYILSEKLEEENIVEKRKPLRVQMEELYQKGLDYKKNGEYKKAEECFEEVISKSRIYGFSDYLKSAEKELVELEKLEEKRIEEEKREKARLETQRSEKERLEKRRVAREQKEKARQESIRQAKLERERKGEEKLKKAKLEEEKRILERERREQARMERVKMADLEKERIRKARLEKKKTEKKPILGVGLGEWFPSEDNNSLMVYEAQLRLKGSLRLFGGGGESSDESSYMSYFGVRIGDKLNLGVGGINSTALEKTELMLIAGFSLGADWVRLEGNYFYVPENEDLNGIRAILGIRF